MNADRSVLFSVLDLAPILAGSDASVSFRNTLDLAQHVERFGYHRYWLAEHHNIPGVGSAATSVLIAHVAGGTTSIRVGAGGIMLSNHAPLAIAEQFGTLESLFPGRIDLGIGRAPGGDGQTARALRRSIQSDDFLAEFEELRTYFRPAAPGQHVHAVPGEGLDVPIYLLGSSDFSARLAAREGLPFAFASHFAPDYLLPALELYHSGFRPSAQLDRPHAIVGVNVFAADTDEEAKRMFTSVQQAFLGIVRGARQQVQPPVDSMDGKWNPAEEAHVSRMLSISAVGSLDTVRRRLEVILDLTDADELILTCNAFDHAARVHSFELAAEAVRKINATRNVASPSLAAR